MCAALATKVGEEAAAQFYAKKSAGFKVDVSFSLGFST